MGPLKFGVLHNYFLYRESAECSQRPSCTTTPIRRDVSSLVTNVILTLQTAMYTTDTDISHTAQYLHLLNIIN